MELGKLVLLVHWFSLNNNYTDTNRKLLDSSIYSLCCKGNMDIMESKWYWPARLASL